jgi:hypothetical protein
LLWRLREIPRNGLDEVPPGLRHTETTRTTTRTASAASGDTVTVETFVVVPGKDTATKYWIVELALGYSQFSGLASRDPCFELRGTVREFPSLTVYMSFDGYVPFATPYIGLRSGLIDVHNLQAVDGLSSTNTTVYGASPKAFEFGGIIGVAFGSWMLAPRVEYAYTKRDFPSVHWSPGTAPTRVPRELSFTGWSVSVGLQVNLSVCR